MEARSKKFDVPQTPEPMSFTAVFVNRGVPEDVPLDNRQPKPTAGSIMELARAARGMDCTLLQIKADDGTVLWERASEEAVGQWKSVARGSAYIRG